MSYSHQRVERQRRTVGGAGYGASTRRSTIGYWVPLVMTVTVATMGLAAWIWSERRDDEDETSDEEHNPAGVPPPPQSAGAYQGPPPADPGSFGAPPMASSGPGYEGGARSTAVETQPQDDGTLMARMSGALRQTLSPQQSYDWASKKVAAGVAAAGAVMGGALTSIREGSQDDYEDHERWSEEADSRDAGQEIKRGIKRRGTAEDYFSGAVEMPKRAAIQSRNRKRVAVVVSAVESGSNDSGEVGQHASILAHLSEHVELENTRVFVLIYTPELKAHPLSTIPASKKAPAATQGSTASSFSNISHGDAHTPGEFPGGSEGGLANIDPNPVDESSSLFKTLYNQALAVVEKDSMIMPFTTPTGHLHILRSLAPETVYIQESLCGEEGDTAASLSGWVRQIVVVIGDEGGHGGLLDTEDEDGLGKASSKRWWQKGERTGLGKGIVVVESLRIGDDWRRRITEHD